MKRFSFRPLSNLTQRIVGTFAELKKFFGKLGEAREEKVQREIDQLKNEKSRLGPNFTTSSVTEERLREKQKQTFGIKELVETLPSGMSQAFYFNELIKTLQNLGRTETSMEVGKIYVFRYIARTKGWYDVFPVSIITSHGKIGLKGYNYHWEKYMNYIQNPYRNYLYDRFESQAYLIKPHELKYVLQLNTFLPIYNR